VVLSMARAFAECPIPARTRSVTVIRTTGADHSVGVWCREVVRCFSGSLGRISVMGLVLLGALKLAFSVGVG
jgi:hypothetical protein